MKESAIIFSRIENVSSALGLEDRDMILRHVALTEEEKRNSLFFFVENDQMGDYYFESEDYDSAIEYYWKALAIVEFELGNDHCYISRELIKIAAAYNTKDEIQKAVEYLDEAVMIDGGSHWTALWRILIPSAIPGLVSVGMYTFMQAWNEYLFALTLTKTNDMRTVPVGINLLMGQHAYEWNQMMAMSVLGSLPILVLFLFFQKYFIAGMTAGAVKS